jgi:rod shape-determining protein MreD
MMRVAPVRYVVTMLALYVGLIADIALRDGVLGPWAPSLTLLVGVLAARRRGGILWASLAGLLCDCVTGRPLGATMFAAGMTAATARVLRPEGSSLRLVDAFLCIAVAEGAARLVAAAGGGSADLLADVAGALKAAITTTLMLVLGLVVSTLVRRVTGRESQPSLVPGVVIARTRL